MKRKENPGIHRGPLRKIKKVMHEGHDPFYNDLPAGYNWLSLECGHQVKGTGKKQSKCYKCAKEGNWNKTDS